MALVGLLLTATGCAGAQEGSDAEPTTSSTPASSETPSETSPSVAASDLDALAEQVLAAAPHAPADVALFGPSNYAEAPPLTAERVPVWDEAQGLAALEDLLEMHVADEGAREAALAAYDDPDVVVYVAEPLLRAGFAYTTALHGPDLLPTNPPFPIVRLGGSISMATAMVGAGTIIINAVQTPPLEALPGLLEHEGLHNDEPVGLPEEVILNAYTAARYFQALLRNPALAHEGSDGVRLSNDQLQFLLNSHPDGDPDISLYATTAGVAPGGVTSPASFAEGGWGRIGAPDEPTPMPEAFRAFLAAELGQEVPEGTDFSTESAELMDQLLAMWLTPVDRLRVEVLLTLRTVEEVAELTGLEEAEAVERLGLQPFLDAAEG